MSPLTILRYLTGNADAIRQVASRPAALGIAIVLVLLTGVARNYDQLLFTETLRWLYGPLLFSAVSGFWLWLFVMRAWGVSCKTAVSADAWLRLRSFYSLFWMTAPIAWLYALPVERWFNSVDAARANVALLATVSLWRVVLMSRVISVIGSISFARGFWPVLLAASIEAAVIVFTSQVTGKHLMAMMGGLVNSPAEDVMMNAFGVVSQLSVVAFLIGLSFSIHHGLLSQGRELPWQPEPATPAKRSPQLWLWLLPVAGLWALACIEPQRELRNTRHAEFLSRKKDLPGLLAWLSAHEKGDFAPAVTLPPTPWEVYDYRQFWDILKLIREDTPGWICQEYAGHLRHLAARKSIRIASSDDRQLIRLALERKEDFQRGQIEFAGEQLSPSP